MPRECLLRKTFSVPGSNFPILVAAKKQIKGQIAVACDNREGFAIDFAKTFLHYGTLKDTARMFALIDALTPDDLLRAARDIFDAGTLSTMTIR